jgi:hypothetical protein
VVVPDKPRKLIAVIHVDVSKPDPAVNHAIDVVFSRRIGGEPRPALIDDVSDTRKFEVGSQKSMSL